MPIPGLQGCGSWSLLLDSFQKPQLDCCNKSSRTIHPPHLGTTIATTTTIITSAASPQDPARPSSSLAAQWLEHPQVVTTSLDARSSRTAMEKGSSSPRQRPSSGRPPSHCQPFSGQQEARYHNGRSCHSFLW